MADTIETRSGRQAGDARRVRAHGRALRHSARVRILRRVLPAAAAAAVLGIAALVLNPFAARLPSVGLGPISVSGTKVTMENPRLSGFKKGERGYEVTADAAQQDVRKPAIVELQAMRGRLATDDKGGFVTLEARGGVFDTVKEALRLDGDILVRTDKGEEARLRSAAVDFKAGSVKSGESVTVTIPSGTLTADSLDVVENGRVISFVGNVHALFRGEEKRAKPVPETAATDPAEGRRTGSAEAPPIRTSSAEAPEMPR